MNWVMSIRNKKGDERGTPYSELVADNPSPIFPTIYIIYRAEKFDSHHEFFIKKITGSPCFITNAYRNFAIISAYSIDGNSVTHLGESTHLGWDSFSTEWNRLWPS